MRKEIESEGEGGEQQKRMQREREREKIKSETKRQRGIEKDTEEEKERWTHSAGERYQEEQRGVGPSHCSEPPLGQEWMAGPSFPASMQGCCGVREVHSGVHTDVPSLPPSRGGAIYISRPLTQLCAH